MRHPYWLFLACAGVGLIVAEEINRQSAGRSVSEQVDAITTTASDTYDAASTAVSNAYDATVAFIKRQEGFSAIPYADAGRTAVGYGHDITGNETTLDPDKLLEGDIAVASNAVDNAVRVPLNANQRTALISLAYNIGATAFANSTLVKLLNNGQTSAAANQFDVWNKVTTNGVKVVSPALVSRRAQEKALFLS